MASVFRNFLSNAVKFTPEYGTISVHVDSMSTDTGRNLAVISVTDSGVGLSKENLRHLFEEVCVICICMFMYICMYMYLYIYACTYICRYIYIYIHIYICVYIYMHIYVYIYICIYTHIHISLHLGCTI
jgi:hypothetical protein